MENFTLKINGLDELIRGAEKAGGELPKMLYNQMVKNTTMIQNEAKTVKTGSFKNRTGNLRRSIAKHVTSASRGEVFVGENYGKYVEFGTNSHVILPKRKKMLAFKINGRQVFAKKVNHPGSRPYPYMEPALKNSAPKIINDYAKIGEIIVRTMAK